MNRFATLADEVGKLRDYIPPKVGQYFVTAGLHYTSFELFDSFTLLSVAFGKRLEIDLLGIVGCSADTRGGIERAAVGRGANCGQGDAGARRRRLHVAKRSSPATLDLLGKCLLEGGLAFYAWFRTRPMRPGGRFRLYDWWVSRTVPATHALSASPPARLQLAGQ